MSLKQSCKLHFNIMSLTYNVSDFKSQCTLFYQIKGGNPNANERKYPTIIHYSVNLEI